MVSIPIEKEKTVYRADLVGMARSSRAKSALPALRAKIHDYTPNAPGPTIIKQLDDQALVILESLHQAVEQSGIPLKEFQNWGTVTSPRHPGRARLIQTMSKFSSEGAPVVSPHIVPFDSLHSQAGIISQAFGLHGPTLGAGGIAGLEGQVFLAGLALLANQEADGIWLGWSCWKPEFGVLNSNGPDLEYCQGLIMGLTPQNSHHKKIGWVEFRGSPGLNQENFHDLDFSFLYRLAGEQEAHVTARDGNNLHMEFHLGS